MTAWRNTLDYLPAIGLFLIGLLISAAAIHHVRRNQETILYRDFYSSAEDRLEGIRIKLAGYLTELDLVASHFGDSPEWPSHFSAMADAIISNEAGVTVVVWAPRITGDSLEAYQRELTQHHGTDISIRGFTVQGDTRVTTAADDHFPLAQNRPPTAISALGLDIGSDPARRSAIEASRDSGAPAATTIVTPLTSLRVAPVLIYQALYDVTPKPSEVAARRAHFRGVVGMAIDLGALISELQTGRGTHSVDSHRLNLTIDDAGGGVIFPARTTNLDANDRKQQWIFEQVVDFAGRQWHFRFTPTPGTFLIDSGPTQVLTLIGLTGSITMGLLGSAGIQRRRRAEALTRELTETNQALQVSEERLMEGERIGEIGYWEFDLRTREGWFSPQINRMFGLPADEPVSLEKLGAMLHPEDRASAWYALSTIESNGGNLPVVPHRIIRPDGSVHWLVANGELRRDALGRAEKITAVTQDVTARQQMLNRLAEQEAEFENLFHNNPLPMMVFAIESLRCIEVNDIAVHRYGFDRARWLGRHLAEMGPDHDPAKLRAMVDAMVVSGETFVRPGDWRHYLADGSVIDVEIASHRVRFRGIDALLTTCIDMTERKRAAREMEASERRQAILMEAIPDGVLTVNSELRIESFNGAAEQIFGYRRDEVLGHPVTCLIPEHADLTEPGRARRIAGSDGNTHRVTARGKNGRTFPIALSVSEASFGDRQLSIGVVRDITGEIRLQNALEESERIFRSVFEDAGVGIATTDAEGRFLRVNRRFREIMELRESELLGSHFYDVTNLAERGYNQRTHLDAFRRGDIDTLHEEYRLTSKAGTPLWVSVTVSAIRRPARSGSDVSSFVVVIEDIAQRREASERLALSQRLEAVGQLTGGIAHDFNNLLTAVLGNLQLAQRHPEPEHLSLRLNAAEKAAQIGADTIRRLLAFASNEPAAPEAIDVNGVIRDVEALIRRSLGSHIEVRIDLTENLPPILADRSEVEQALLNLAINARDAMPDGGLLEIATESSGSQPGDANAGYGSAVPAYRGVIITVTDNGMGMSPGVRARVFEPFFTTKEKGKGTGLGLSGVYGFVQRYGGQITLDSAPGEGTRFQLQFPAAVDERLLELHPGTDTDVTSTGAGELILVVDDQALIREVCVAMLEELGYRAISAAGPDDALALLDARPDIALIITDILMSGGLSGVELASEVQRRHPGLPLLFASGYTEGSLDMVNEPIRLLRKPFGSAELAEAVAAVLDNSPTRTDSGPTP